MTAPTRVPNVFIVGEPRCGTTALHTYLGQTPDIACGRVKEPHYFGSDLNYPSRPQTWDEYLSLFDGTNQRWLIDASVFYLMSTEAAREIQARSPDARIIILLRHPVDLMYSLHAENRFNGREPEPVFELALAAEPDRRAGKVPPDCRFAAALLYTQVASFAEQIKRYDEVFAIDRVKILLLEDMERSPRDVVNEVRELLGLVPVNEGTFPVINRSRQVRSKAVRHMHAQSPGVLRHVVRRVTSRGTRRAALNVLRRLNSAPNTRPALDPVLRRTLALRFESDIAWLESRLHRDLSAWRS